MAGYLYFTIALVLSLGVSYGLALLGEPQAVWFWSILGAIQ